MGYVQPHAVVAQMIQAGAAKARLPLRDLWIRGALAGAFLGYATTLALTAAAQSQVPILGAVLFPVGFVLIVLLGLELVTGNFALVPLAVIEGKARWSHLLHNWGWVFVAHLVGSVFYAALFYVAATKMGQVPGGAVAQKLVHLAEAKTLGYQELGWAGMVTVFIKAILCNWMVTLGAVMALTTPSVIGKIVAMWLPILTFFAQGFEHAVVNMFVIPAGMMLGAEVGLADWWLWNQIPVTLGNLVGGMTFTGLALYLTHRKQEATTATPAPMGLPDRGQPEGVSS